MKRAAFLWPCLAVALALQAVWLAEGAARDYRDLWEVFIGDRRAIGETWHDSGRLPTWNPRHQCGSPVPANFGRGIYYPLHWPAYLWPSAESLAWVAALHVAIACAGMMLLLRSWQLEWTAQVAGGVAFAGGGIIANLHGYPQMAATAAWLPFALLAADHALRTGRLRSAVLAGCALGLGVLAGEPQVSAMTGLLVVLLAVARTLTRDRSAPDAPALSRLALRAAATVGLTALISACIGAPEVIASLELLTQSPRAEGLGAREALGWSLAQRDLLGMLSPCIWGDGIREWYGLPFRKPPSFLLGLSPGLGVLALAIAGLSAWRHAAVRFAALACVIFVTLAASPALGLGEALQTLPVFSWFRYPIKYLVGAAPAIAVLAAFGFVALKERGPRLAATAVAAGLALGLGGLGLALDESLYLKLAGPVELPDLWTEYGATAVAAARESLLLSASVSGVCALVIGLSHLGSMRAVALLCVLLEPVLFSAWLHAPGAMASTPPVVDALRAEAGGLDGFRVATVYSAEAIFRAEGQRPEVAAKHQLALLGWASGMNYGMSTMNGYGSPGLADWLRLRSLRLSTREATDDWMYRLHEIAATRYIVTPYKLRSERARLVAEPEEGVKLWELPGVLPRAYVAARIVPVAERGELESLLASSAFDHHTEALIETSDLDSLGQQVSAASRAQHSVATIERDEGDRVVVHGSGPGLLVLADTDYPGWHATVDAVPARLFRTNGLFRGVLLPAGQHEVVFQFVPNGQARGLAVLALTLVLIALACLRDLMPSRRAS